MYTLLYYVNREVHLEWVLGVETPLFEDHKPLWTEQHGVLTHEGAGLSIKIIRFPV